MATTIMTERHTGVNIGTTISQICEEFNVGRNLAIVTDNASNMSIYSVIFDENITKPSNRVRFDIQDNLLVGHGENARYFSCSNRDARHRRYTHMLSEAAAGIAFQRSLN